MKTVYHTAATRGFQDHGWLKANHSFSFANWHHPDRVHFGALRVFCEGDIQVISAGTGIYHSEQNQSEDSAVELLQLWFFPNQKDVTPRYDQISIRDLKKENAFYQILSPDPKDGGSWVYQDVWMHLGDFSKALSTTYTLGTLSNGVYVFVLEGGVKIGDHSLTKRDALGVWDTPTIEFDIEKNSRILLIDVPLKF